MHSYSSVFIRTSLRSTKTNNNEEHRNYTWCYNFLEIVCFRCCVVAGRILVQLSQEFETAIKFSDKQYVQIDDVGNPDDRR